MIITSAYRVCTPLAYTGHRSSLTWKKCKRRERSHLHRTNGHTCAITLSLSHRLATLTVYYCTTAIVNIPVWEDITSRFRPAYQLKNYRYPPYIYPICKVSAGIFLNFFHNSVQKIGENLPCDFWTLTFFALWKNAITRFKKWVQKWWLSLVNHFWIKQVVR